MATTMSITLDDEVFAAAQQIATRQGIDVESMISRLLLLMAENEKPFDVSALPPITRAALGLAKGIPDRPYKELLVEILTDRYNALK